jgi:hypothetical protein
VSLGILSYWRGVFVNVHPKINNYRGTQLIFVPIGTKLWWGTPKLSEDTKINNYHGIVKCTVYVDAIVKCTVYVDAPFGRLGEESLRF